MKLLACELITKWHHIDNIEFELAKDRKTKIKQGDECVVCCSFECRFGVAAVHLMKGLINSMRSTIMVTELFTVMGHTQANQEVNYGTYCSFNLSHLPAPLLRIHGKHRRNLEITFANGFESFHRITCGTNSRILSARPTASRISKKIWEHSIAYHFSAHLSVFVCPFSVLEFIEIKVCSFDLTFRNKSSWSWQFAQKLSLFILRVHRVQFCRKQIILIWYQMKIIRILVFAKHP